jgi:hypothetical protein
MLHSSDNFSDFQRLNFTNTANAAASEAMSQLRYCARKKLQNFSGKVVQPPLAGAYYYRARSSAIGYVIFFFMA